jgi:hypothetical protein
MTVGKIVDGVREVGSERGLKNAFFDDLDEARAWIAKNS